MATTTKTAVMCTNFTHFSDPVHERFVEMSKGELYVTDCGDALFDAYLQAFPEGTNPIFRERTVHDCQCCKRFIRRIGKVVGIKDGKLVTVWGDLQLPEPYKTVADKLDELVRCASVVAVFRTKERKYGEDHNYDPKTHALYDHFYAEVAPRHLALDPATKRGEQDAIFQVAKRGLAELKVTDLEAVLDLIASNGLYRGEEHRPAVQGFLDLKRQYDAAERKDLFVWEHLGHRYARFRNTVIGTMLVEMAEGKALDDAVKAFQALTAASMEDLEKQLAALDE